MNGLQAVYVPYIFKSHSSIKTSIGASLNCSAIYVPYIFSFKKLTNRSNILGKTCIQYTGSLDMINYILLFYLPFISIIYSRIDGSLDQTKFAIFFSHHKVYQTNWFQLSQLIKFFLLLNKKFCIKSCLHKTRKKFKLTLLIPQCFFFFFFFLRIY